jgi:Fe-S-cluster containining protein
MKKQTVDFPDGLNFKCRHCGSCCKAHPSDVNVEEQAKIESVGFIDFLEGNIGDVTRRIRAKDDGSCFFLNKDNNCVIYDARPAACKLEPLTIVDYDYEKNRIELDVNPAAICDSLFSCKGLSSGGKLSIEDMTKAAQTTLNEFLEFFSRQKGLPVTSKEVAFLTSKHFKESYLMVVRIAEIVNQLSSQ